MVQKRMGVLRLGVVLVIALMLVSGFAMAVQRDVVASPLGGSAKSVTAKFHGDGHGGDQDGGGDRDGDQGNGRGGNDDPGSGGNGGGKNWSDENDHDGHDGNKDRDHEGHDGNKDRDHDDNDNDGHHHKTKTPKVEPTLEPTEVVTEEPTLAPTEIPTETATDVPTEVPTETATLEPTVEPTAAATETEESTGQVIIIFERGQLKIDFEGDGVFDLVFQFPRWAAWGR